MPVPQALAIMLFIWRRKKQLDRATPAFAIASNAVRNQPEFTCVLGQNLAYRNSESGFVRVSKGLAHQDFPFSGSHPKSDASRNQLPTSPCLKPGYFIHDTSDGVTLPTPHLLADEIGACTYAKLSSRTDG